jgi:uracil-DNA glycosylase family 4
MTTDREAQMAAIAEEIRLCNLCELCRGRSNPVPGAGNPNAEVLFIGEAPGMHEDQQGLPFVGNSGKFLNEMLDSIGWSRDDVFVTNVVKCRPPGNRDPLPDEIAACATHLERQIDALDPLMIVTLGRFSMSKWFANERISRIHGEPREVGKRVIVPMYHPAAALHQPSLRETIKADMQRLPVILDEFKQKLRAEQDSGSGDISQMKLF